MWFHPRRIHPSNALRDDPTNSRAECRGDQVWGSLTAHVCISLRAFGHLAGIETRREISELMGRASKTAADSACASNTSTTTGSTPAARSPFALVVERVVPIM